MSQIKNLLNSKLIIMPQCSTSNQATTPSLTPSLANLSELIRHAFTGLSNSLSLWLKNLNPLTPTNIVDRTTTTKIPGNWFNKGGKDRWKQRSETFQGIADAMATQWGQIV